MFLVGIVGVGIFIGGGSYCDDIGVCGIKVDVIFIIVVYCI